MFFQRLVLACATLAACLCAHAASVETRSPFRQGHWWNPAKSGNGFEILNASGRVMLVWYTYDEASRPVWYTAQGDQADLGSIWPLQKHRWANGRIAQSTDVGIMRVRVEHFEKITTSWQVGGNQGSWTLEPFIQSGTVNEVDLTGHWFDPTQSGWGMTLLDQGDVFGAVIYAYDPAGEPTWAAGFQRGKGTRIELFSTRGSCPGCEYRATGVVGSVGTIDVGYRGDTEATVRGTLAMPLASDLRIDGARLAQLGRPASTRRGDFQLVPFARAETLKAYLVAGMENRTFSAGSDFSAAPPNAGSPSFSMTNVQEAGVDEGDVVKTDGNFIYSITPAVLSYTGATTTGYVQKIRVVNVGPGGMFVDPVSEMPLYGRTEPSWYGYMDSNLYLHAGRLATVSSSYYYGGWYVSAPESSKAQVEILDVADPARPTSHWRATISGSVISSRRIGDRLYLVTRFTPSVPGYYQYPWNDQMRASNAAAIAAASPESLLPRISINDGAPSLLVPPSSVYAPQLGGNVPVADLVVVTVIDIVAERVVDTIAIAGRTEALYVSPSNLYLASMRYNWQSWNLDAIARGPLYSTDIHQVRIDGDRLAFVGSASVEGFVGWGEKASFRFGEDHGKLGVVSSLFGWWGDNSNRVTVLEPSTSAPGLLKTVSYLPNAQRPEPLGKPNERLYGTRFVGDKLYAVTFRQVDPLYIVDLSNKSDPRITGALEIPGFSDYLHPLPGGLLLGFGRDATSTGLMQGLQMSLFDVSGPAPRAIDQVQIGKRGSDSALFRSHHAFSALQRANGSTLVAFPAAVHEGAAPADAWSYYPWAYNALLRYEVQGTSAASARLVALPSLLVTQGTSDYYSNWNSDERGSGLGRSVLFPDSSIYIGNGKFWRLDNNTGTTAGPY